MNRYDIGDVLVQKNSYYREAYKEKANAYLKLAGMIVSIVPVIKVKWCGIDAVEIVPGYQLERYIVHKAKRNENRTPNDV